MKRASIQIAGMGLVVFNLLFLLIEDVHAREGKGPQSRKGTQAEHSFNSSARASLRTPSRRGNLANLRFRRLCSQRGSWQGHIVGAGHFLLQLSIIRNGVVESTRLIGRIQRDAGEKPTSFAFRSAIPPGNGWSWRITAQSI